VAVETELTVDDELRAALLAREEALGLSQNGHARLLGIGQGKLSEFYARRRGITVRLARAVYSHHPELRPVLHAWLTEHSADEGAT